MADQIERDAGLKVARIFRFLPKWRVGFTSEQGLLLRVKLIFA